MENCGNQQEISPVYSAVILNRGTAPLTARIQASKSQCDQHIAGSTRYNSPREATAMAKQDAPVDPKVQKWLEENAISTGKADINLVVTEGQKETKIPVMKSILAVHSGLIRGLPDTDDVPIIGDHDSRTVVQYVTLCYPRLDAQKT